MTSTQTKASVFQLSERNRETFHTWLHELTHLSSVAGRERVVIQWLKDWGHRKKNIAFSMTKSGNLMLEMKREGKSPSEKRITLVAHMDHPGFAVTSIIDSKTLSAELRGGIKPAYCVEPKARIKVTRLSSGQVLATGRITEFSERKDATQYSTCQIKLNKSISDLIPPEDLIATWQFSTSATGRKGPFQYRSPACDNLAGVSAALSAFELIRSKQRQFPEAASAIRILFTRAEEIGFIGALGCCHNKEIKPKDGPVIVLENSNELPEAPIDGGAIVRIGDRISTFDPMLLESMVTAAMQLENKDKTYQWQRKLMSGGSCEATVFCQYGYTCACACVPLGNYHNMSTETGMIAPEYISIHDYENLILLLTQSVHVLSQSSTNKDMKGRVRTRLEELYQQQKHILDE